MELVSPTTSSVPFRFPDHPLLGGYVAEDSSRNYREIRQGNYRALYRSDGQALYIVAIHHAARLLDTEGLT